MDWSDVGSWLKDKGGSLFALAGAVATGNIPAGVSAVASLVSQATGETDAAKALIKLQTDPATQLELERLIKENEQDIRLHHREMLRLELEDKQKAHKEQQETIRSGDNASDDYVRHTRPMVARQSWYATITYIFVMEIGHAAKVFEAKTSIEIAMVLLAPAAAYFGFRTFDGIWGKKGK